MTTKEIVKMDETALLLYLRKYGAEIRDRSYELKDIKSIYNQIYCEYIYKKYNCDSNSSLIFNIIKHKKPQEVSLDTLNNLLCGKLSRKCLTNACRRLVKSKKITQINNKKIKYRYLDGK